MNVTLAALRMSGPDPSSPLHNGPTSSLYIPRAVIPDGYNILFLVSIAPKAIHGMDTVVFITRSRTNLAFFWGLYLSLTITLINIKCGLQQQAVSWYSLRPALVALSSRIQVETEYHLSISTSFLSIAQSVCDVTIFVTSLDTLHCTCTYYWRHRYLIVVAIAELMVAW